ncbi:MAG: methylated-DNA--[protein]-cysteine S-methyltransferase [Candidatus Heimdallarchaeota archaeon]|nr:methylated-DNA--[protein]-cysteine S-methyltransferase [Candidatus Heimdallarchaeota archaeon]
MKISKIVHFKSPVGFLKIKANQEGITSLEFVDEEFIENLKTIEDPILSKCVAELGEYFKGERRVFSLPLAHEGTSFQKKVWNELLKIPFGETRSYKDIAIKIGNENASRAVGLANNKNPIVIIIPCHRVIGSNKKLIGYGGGLWRKEWLLEHERKNSATISQLDSFLTSENISTR